MCTSRRSACAARGCAAVGCSSRVRSQGRHRPVSRAVVGTGGGTARSQPHQPRPALDAPPCCTTLRSAASPPAEVESGPSALGAAGTPLSLTGGVSARHRCRTRRRIALIARHPLALTTFRAPPRRRTAPHRCIAIAAARLIAACLVVGLVGRVVEADLGDRPVLTVSECLYRRRL